MSGGNHLGGAAENIASAATGFLPEESGRHPHLLTSAQESVPDGRHMDFDPYGGRSAEDSAGLCTEVEKKGPRP
ncbi:hypothetical protein A6A07_19385 [Streptomyces sp. CB03911]|nr:hypothetical protein A6A07_19385 [Streptomyces sp. CB03911]